MFIEKMKLNLRALQIKFIGELEWISDWHDMELRAY